MTEVQGSTSQGAIPALIPLPFLKKETHLLLSRRYFWGFLLLATDLNSGIISELEPECALLTWRRWLRGRWQEIGYHCLILPLTPSLFFHVNATVSKKGHDPYLIQPSLLYLDRQMISWQKPWACGGLGGESGECRWLTYLPSCGSNVSLNRDEPGPERSSSKFRRDYKSARDSIFCLESAMWVVSGAT